MSDSRTAQVENIKQAFAQETEHGALPYMAVYARASDGKETAEAQASKERGRQSTLIDTYLTTSEEARTLVDSAEARAAEQKQGIAANIDCMIKAVVDGTGDQDLMQGIVESLCGAVRGRTTAQEHATIQKIREQAGLDKRRRLGEPGIISSNIIFRGSRVRFRSDTAATRHGVYVCRAAQRHVLLPPRRSEGSEKALVENRANGIDPAGVHELAHDRLELGPPNWTRMRTRQKGSQMIDILGFLTRWQGNRVSVPKAPKSSM